MLNAALNEPEWIPQLSLPTQDDLPGDDGIPMETERHNKQMDLLIYPLEAWLNQRGYVGGNMFVYYSLKQVRYQETIWLRWATLNGEVLPTAQEISDREMRRADAEAKRAKVEAQRANAEAQRATLAEQRIAAEIEARQAAEAEIARLQTLLANDPATG